MYLVSYLLGAVPFGLVLGRFFGKVDIRQSGSGSIGATNVFAPFIGDCPNCTISSETVRFQNAVGIGLAALPSFAAGQTVSPDQLLPFYLRLPQAERELKMKNMKKVGLE